MSLGGDASESGAGSRVEALATYLNGGEEVGEGWSSPVLPPTPERERGPL